MTFTHAAHGLEGWSSNWSRARTQAQQTGRPLLVMFVNQGCSECDKMERVLATNKARTALTNAVRVRLEYDSYAQLAGRLGVTGTPTTMLFTSETGYDADVYREEGALSVRDVERLGKTIDRMCPQVPPEAPAPKPSPTPTATRKKTEECPPETRPTPQPEHPACVMDPGGSFYQW